MHVKLGCVVAYDSRILNKSIQQCLFASFTHDSFFLFYRVNILLHGVENFPKLLSWQTFHDQLNIFDARYVDGEAHV